MLTDLQALVGTEPNLSLPISRYTKCVYSESAELKQILLAICHKALFRSRVFFSWGKLILAWRQIEMIRSHEQCVFKFCAKINTYR